MRIIASGSYTATVSGEPPPLKVLARESTGASMRRIGRFVQLALVGAGRCVEGRTLEASTATYFTSGRGDLEVTLDVLAQICEHGHSPAPFTFINTVGNSACFHIAKCFGLRGRSQFVTSRYAPLEAALRLAALDLSHGGVATALVGSTDVCTAPLDVHRERIGVLPDTPVGEGSHWFLLAADEGPGMPLGVLRSVRSFPDDASLRRHLERHRGELEGAALAFGQHLGADHAEALRRATGIGRVFDYRSDLPWYDSQTGQGIHRFLIERQAPMLVHVDGDPSGRRTLLIIDAALRGATGATPSPRDRRIA
jgi:hypothetical protein